MDLYRVNPTEITRRRRDAFINSKRLMVGNVGPFVLHVEGHDFRFEFSGVSGPMLVDAEGEVLSRQPGARSKFWSAFDRWRKAGCYVDNSGRAIMPSDRILASLSTPTDGEKR